MDLAVRLRDYGLQRAQPGRHTVATVPLVQATRAATAGGAPRARRCAGARSSLGEQRWPPKQRMDILLHCSGGEPHPNGRGRLRGRAGTLGALGVQLGFHALPRVVLCRSGLAGFDTVDRFRPSRAGRRCGAGGGALAEEPADTFAQSHDGPPIDAATRAAPMRPPHVLHPFCCVAYSW